MKNASVFRMLCKLVLVLGLVVASVKAQPVTKVVDHGPDGEKLTFVVLGDGYAAGDQAECAKTSSDWLSMGCSDAASIRKCQCIQCLSCGLGVERLWGQHVDGFAGYSAESNRPRAPAIQVNPASVDEYA